MIAHQGKTAVKHWSEWRLAVYFILCTVHVLFASMQ